MVITQQDQEEANGEFAAGFDSPPAEAAAMTEDEAFGLSAEIPDDSAGEGSAPLEMDSPEAVPAEVAPAGEMPAEAMPAEEAPAEQAGLDLGAEAAEPALEEAMEPAGNEALEAEYQAAVQQVSEDFGPEFIGNFLTIIKYESARIAREGTDSAINPVMQTVNEAIEAVHAAFQSQHFAAIREAHEDYIEVVSSPEFGQWVQSLPAEKQAEVAQVQESGAHREVIAMLNAYKKSLDKGAVDEFDSAMDAAEGVRSSGMSLPAEPQANDDFERAWNEA